MLQKMDFLAEDLSDLREPTRDELQTWFKNNAQRFAYPPRITFHHLYFSFDRHGAKTAQAAATALKQIADKPLDSPQAAALADPFMFRDYYADRSPDQVSSEFGNKFERSVFELKSGSWLGPIEWGFGWHLVFVDSLGIAGGPQDADYLEKRLEVAWKSKDSTDLGAELAADLELRGPSRVAWIEEKYFVDHDRIMPEIQAALLAMGEQGRADAAVPRWRVIQAYKVFIREHEDLTGLVAKNLAEWKCWEFEPQFRALVQSTASRPNPYRKGLLYYLVCRNNDEGVAQPLPAKQPLPVNGWLRDPLLYFLAISVALFTAYSAIRVKQR
jgi:parvulin-like peptidyl-prolyl cis-trans isomerase-like protein